MKVEVWLDASVSSLHYIEKITLTMIELEAEAGSSALHAQPKQNAHRQTLDITFDRDALVPYPEEDVPADQYSLLMSSRAVLWAASLAGVHPDTSGPAPHLLHLGKGEVARSPLPSTDRTVRSVSRLNASEEAVRPVDLTTLLSEASTESGRSESSQPIPAEDPVQSGPLLTIRGCRPIGSSNVSNRYEIDLGHQDLKTSGGVCVCVK